MLIIALRPMFHATKLLTSKQSVKQMKTNTFDKVNVAIYDANNRKVDVSASQVAVKKDNATLDKMTSSFTLSNGEKCEISSDNTKTLSKENIFFQGNVRMNTTSGLTLVTDHAAVDLSKKTAMGKAHLKLSKGENQISGDYYYVDLEKKILTLSKNAKARTANDSITANQLIITLSKNNRLKDVQAEGNIKYLSPKYSIATERMSFHNNKLELRKNVRIKGLKKKANIQGNNAVITLDNAHKVTSVEISGNSEYFSNDYRLKAQKIVYRNGLLQARGKVRLNCNKNSRKYVISSNSLTANIVNEKISQIRTQDKLTIEANNDTIKANSCILRGNKLFLSGDVSAIGGVGGIFGDNAELDLATGRVKISNSSGVIEEGRNAK